MIIYIIHCHIFSLLCTIYDSGRQRPPLMGITIEGKNFLLKKNMHFNCCCGGVFVLRRQ